MGKMKVRAVWRLVAVSIVLCMAIATLPTAALAISVGGPVWRFYDVKLGAHFYTASMTERDYVIATWPRRYRFEGIAWFAAAPPENPDPLYRFYNMKNGAHFYTPYEAEKAYILVHWSDIYRFEGVAYYVSIAPTGMPVYRFYNKQNHTHFYTAVAAERDAVIATLGYLYQYEGIGFYLASDGVEL